MADHSENNELSVEEVFANDIDPLDAIRDIRREEGVAEADLPLSDEVSDSQDDQDSDNDNGDDELDNLEDEKDTGDDNDNDDTDNADEYDTDSDPGSDKDTDDEDADQGTEDESASKDKPAKVVTRKFKANGQEFEFSEDEMMDQFEQVFGKAMDYTQKMQNIAPYRKMISALETEGVTSEQLNLAIDALKGNKQALKQMIEDNKLDAYDLTDDSSKEQDPYTPTNYGKNDVELGIEEVSATISNDPEYKITVDVIDNQWDQTSRQAFATNPELIRGLHNDIKTGLYDKVAPMAMKMKVLDGNTKSNIEYYMLAGEKLLESEKQTSADAEKTVADNNKKAQDVDDEFDQASSEASKKRSASNTRKRSDRKGVTDYLDDDNDEEFDAWYRKTMAAQ